MSHDHHETKSPRQTKDTLVPETDETVVEVVDLVTDHVSPTSDL